MNFKIQENRPISDPQFGRNQSQYDVNQQFQPQWETKNNFMEKESGLINVSHQSSSSIRKIGIQKSKNAYSQELKNVFNIEYELEQIQYSNQIQSCIQQTTPRIINENLIQKARCQWVTLGKSSIHFFVNEYRKFLVKNEKQGQEMEILEKLKNKAIPSQRKYSIKDIQGLLKQYQDFQSSFKEFLESEILETRIKSYWQIKGNRQNYQNLKALMIDEIKSIDPFKKFLSKKKNLDKYQLVFLKIE